VFGTHKIFRDNPVIPEGKMKSILTSVKFHSTQSQRIFTTGWSLAASAEVAGKSFSGDYDFNSYCIDVRRYQPISDYDVVNVRLRAGSATGEVPLQKAFDLGGFSTIPAFRFKEFTGNRMLLANAEYVINGKMFDEVEFFPSWLLRNLNIILFADAGYVGSAKSTDTFSEGFKDINSNTIHSDWGFGIGTRYAKLRLGFAWRTDKSGPPMVFVRLNRPF
jgi:outer membrane protein assembly factor BamA